MLRLSGVLDKVAGACTFSNLQNQTNGVSKDTSGLIWHGSRAIGVRTPVSVTLEVLHQAKHHVSALHIGTQIHEYQAYSMHQQNPSATLSQHGGICISNAGSSHRRFCMLHCLLTTHELDPTFDHHTTLIKPTTCNHYHTTLQSLLLARSSTDLWGWWIQGLVTWVTQGPHCPVHTVRGAPPPTAVHWVLLPPLTVLSAVQCMSFQAEK
jgi:hypothetical protein